MGAVRDILYSRMGGKFSTPFLALLIKRLYMASPSAGYEELTVSGNAPLTLANAVAKAIKSLTQTGLCAQASTPTPSAPVDIVCNNGTVKVRHRSGLPVRYQLLSYLRANANVDVGVKTTKNTELEAAWTRITSAAQYLYQSDSNSSGSTNTTAYITSGGNWRFGNLTASISPSQDKRYVSIQNSNGVSLNGEQVASYGTVGSFTSTNTLRVLGSGASLRIEYLKVRQSGVLVRDLVPVRDTVDGTYGFYDLVGGTFYTNGNATFTPGAEVDDPIEVVAVGTPEVLTVGGKNLFYNDEAWARGFYLVNDKVASAPANRTFIMRCTPNTTYYWKHCSLVGGIRAFTVDEDEVAVGVDGTWIKPNPVVGEINEVYSATTGATAKWLCVCFGRSHKDAAPIDDQWSDFMLSTIPLTADTPYEPYREPQTASVPDIYAVGDYKDEVDLVSGTVTRRVGVKVLDGTEADWLANSAVGIWMLRLWDKRIGSAMALTSTHFTGTNAGTASMPDNSIKFYNSTAFNYNGTVFIKATAYSTLDDFKAYLAAQYAAGTPVIIVYPLAEATTESVEGQSLSTVAGTNVVSVTAEVSPVALEAVYYGSEE